MGAKITKIDTDGVITSPNTIGDLSMDNHVAGGDAGRLYYNDGTDDIAVARKDEIDNIDNTSDANKPVSTAQQTALDLKADQNDVDLKANTIDVVALAGTQTITGDKTFTGTTIVPTQATDDNSTKAASTAFVQQEIAATTSTSLSTVASTALLIGDLTISAGDLTHTGLSFGYTLGKNADGGFNTTTEQVTTGSYDLAAVVDGLHWIAREYGTGNLVTFDKRPAMSPIGGAVWFNTEDGKWYQNPFAIEADGSTNTNVVNAIPLMTSNTAPSGVASASSITVGDPAYEAFDRNTGVSSRWNSASNVFPQWLQYQYPTVKAINKYKLFVNANYPTYTPRSWTLEGSNTGAFGGEEVVVDTRTDIASGTITAGATFTCSNSIEFLYYRLNITANNGAATVLVTTFEMFEAQEAQEMNGGEVANGTELTSPISFLSEYPYNVVSGEVVSLDDGELPANTNYIKDLAVQGLATVPILNGLSINIKNLPTVDPAISGELWNDANTLKVSIGV